MQYTSIHVISGNSEENSNTSHHQERNAEYWIMLSAIWFQIPFRFHLRMCAWFRHVFNIVSAIFQDK